MQELSLLKKVDNESDIPSDNQEIELENINTEQTSEDADDGSTGGVFDDLLGSLLDLGVRFFIVLVTAMLDCVEQSFANMTYSSGKNFKWVLLVVLTYLPVSLFSPLLGYRTVIMWQDALIALLVTTCIFAINNITKSSIDKMVDNIKSIKQRK